MSGLGAMMGVLAGMSMAFGDGLSYLDSARMCATCKAKGLDKDESGESNCEDCPYYDISLTMPEEGECQNEEAGSQSEDL